ncbi:SgcJ/EcaC family oxidoreductase [Streptosporangium carneum]|uniref:DUF4440 domain-containing protein n=1 Tax=Streptosporangium carneum TaxID=47481 RepID=A0A9W6MDH3_9ACTN|nr:SgcJ/EcaC family oxidoreductase [Streptosporangium carneum]GLK10509.1 hypothetical protein GCM10017600_39150 [Streptosporangium carneum]
MTAGTGQTTETVDVRQIRELLDRMTEAWNAGDATAYAAQFTEDADYITFFGMHVKGRAAIEEGHRALFDGPLKGSRLTGGTGETALSIRFLRPDVALVISTGNSSLGEKPDPSRNSVITLTAVRQPDAWRFTSLQNTRRTDMGKPVA